MSGEHREDDNTVPFMPISVGTVILHYKIIGKIGSGGMGEVYLAEDTSLNRQVALKFLPSQDVTEEDLKSRFKREAQAAAALSHPNIVTIHEVNEASGRPFIAMEYVEGQSLGDVIKCGWVTVQQAIDITIQTCQGLIEAHEAGVVHRDLKPANILIDKKNRARLVDFGLAKIIGKSKLTRSGTTLGTIGYMAPEQLKGMPVDHRSDIFSLGVVLYEMLTGRQPFRRDNEAATIQAILNENPEPVARYKADVPETIQQIIDKALEKDREMRYQHVDELLSDLKRSNREITSERPNLVTETVVIKPHRVRRSIRFFALPAALAAIILFSMVIPPSRHTILKWFGVKPAMKEKHLAVIPFTNLGETAINQAFCDGLLETVTSKITQLEQFYGSVRVVPASEVREARITSARQARQAFGVTLAVTGSIQRLGDAVQMTLNLVDAKDERQLHAAIINNPLSDISSLQDSTVINLVSMLEVELQPEERRLLTAGGTTSPDAYDFYLQARGHLGVSEIFSSAYAMPDLYDVRNIDISIGFFQQALAEDADYALAYAGLAEAYLLKHTALGEPEWLELADYNGQHAMGLNDGLAEVHITTGMINMATGSFEKALKYFERARKIDPVSRKACQGAATAYEKLDKADRAESTLEYFIELRPDCWDGYFDLSEFYLRQGRSEDAAGLLNKVEELGPEGYEIINNLGGLYFIMGYWDKAGKMFERSLKIEPNYGAYSNLGAIYYFETRYTDAAGMYEKALELDDQDYRVWMNLASAYYWTPGQREKGLATYRKTIQMAEEYRTINPGNREVLAHLAECYVPVGEQNLALSLIEQALSLEPDNIDFMVRGGLVYEVLGKRDKALECIEKALDHGYPVEAIESVPELEPLLNDPRFELFRGQKKI